MGKGPEMRENRRLKKVLLFLGGIFSAEFDFRQDVKLMIRFYQLFLVNFTIELKGQIPVTLP